MKKLVLTLLCLMFATSGAFAADVYLRDGSVIKARSVSRSGDKITVLINNESIAEFNASEIDLKRTFRNQNRRVNKQEVKPVDTALVSKNTDNHSSTIPPKPSSASTASQVVPQTAKPASQAVTPPPAPVNVKVTPPAPEPSAPLTPPPAPAPAALSIVPIVVGLFVVLLMLAAFWKIFEKAGEAGWKSLIPVYNAYLLVVISGKPGWWFILFFIPFIGVVINLLVCLSLAERFGKGGLYGVGLFLLGPILYLHLAFSDAEYQG